MQSVSYKKGFTLVEMIVYLGLYAIIFTGALAGVYSIFESSARNQTKAMVSEEGAYLLGKVDWVLGGAVGITTPVAGADGTTLVVHRYDDTNIELHITTDGHMTITNGALVDAVLNNDNVDVVLLGADKGFVHTEASTDGLTPESVRASFTLTATTTQGLPYAQSFSTVRFLRK